MGDGIDAATAYDENGNIKLSFPESPAASPANVPAHVCREQVGVLAGDIGQLRSNKAAIN
jgi:hypothetical protein